MSGEEKKVIACISMFIPLPVVFLRLLASVVPLGASTKPFPAAQTVLRQRGSRLKTKWSN